MRLRDLDRGELPATMTAQQVADALDIHVESLRQLVREGRAPVPVLHVGRSLRFPTARVLDALGISQREGAAVHIGGSLESITQAGQKGAGGDCADDNTTARAD